MRIDERPVGQAPCHRVHGEVPAAQILFDRGCWVDDDLEVVAPRAGRDLAPWRCELDSRADELAHFRIAWVETHADGPSCDDQLLRAPVRIERRAQPCDVHARDEKVRILGVGAEQLVADRAADDVRVEA